MKPGNYITHYIVPLYVLFGLCYDATHSHTRQARYYVLIAQNVGLSNVTDNDIFAEVTVPSSDDCLVMCLADELCMTYGHVDSLCTLSGNRLESTNFEKFSSPGQQVFSSKYNPKQLS